MNRARILLLAVALVAGGLAAFLATRGDAPQVVQSAAAPQIVRQEHIKVLIASQMIGMGERLSETSVQWQDWPKDAVRPEYITSENLPDAPEQMTGTVARFEIFTGEPIRQAKLVHADQGYLSAIIPQGMRAVSIGVTAESGAGGFIIPNDRVDVVLTRRNGRLDVSETILLNVRVLAIGHRLGEHGAAEQGNENDPRAQVFEKSAIATLELSPVQAETVINAGAAGKLALILRSVADFMVEPGTEGQKRASQTITLIRAGQEAKVTSTGNDGFVSAAVNVEPLEPASSAPALVVGPVTGTTTSSAPAQPPVQLQ